MPREKLQCGNPLFLSWVEELRDQAREKGTKAAESYGKAARSVAACPTPFARPRELVVLQGVGPKIVNVLEGKWRKHCEENGLPLPGTPEKKSKGKERASATPGLDDSAPIDSDAPADEPAPKKRKPSKPKAPKRYIPAHQSGGYGLLMGLVLAIDRPDINTQVFLTKGELIKAAQPYCDSSYDHSEKGTYFTAWSSMKTLVTKGYIYVTGNPHKYCLTEDGYEVACSIRALRPEFAHLPKLPWLYDSLDPLAAPGPSTFAGPSVPSNARAASMTFPPSPPETSDEASVPPPAPIVRPVLGGPSRRVEKFQFWYIDSAGHRVSFLGQAMSRLDPEEFVPIRKLEFRHAQRDHPFVSQLRLVDQCGQTTQTIFGFIFEDGAPPCCSKFEEAITLRDSTSALPRRDTRSALEEEEDDWIETVPALTQIKSDIKAPFSKTVSAPVVFGEHLNPIRDPIATGSDVLARSQSTASTSTSKVRPRPRLSSHIPTYNPLIEEDETEPAANIPDFDPATDGIVYPAGSYDVVLILDTREVESKTNRDRIAEKLLDKGVNVETRALKLGDMCWIARRKDGMGGEEDECVLDYVVERKRLDDLCSSIRDGRYNEQCHRLTNSCINNVFYIVEDWQTSHNMEFSGLQIMTAKSQIQVHNRFFLQETHRLSETIDFLTTMTRSITSSHRDKDLHVIPTRYLSRSSYGGLQKHLKATRGGRAYLTSWQAYQELNDKNASKTLKERFARMLMCIKGVSAEKVSAILDEYDTPKALWEALKARREEERVYERTPKTLSTGEAGIERSGGSSGKGKAKAKSKARRGPELFFADRIPGEGRRKIGDALSKDLYRVFMGSEENDDGVGEG